MAGEGIGGTNQPASLSVKESSSNSFSSNLFIAVYQNGPTEDFSFGGRDKVGRLLEGTVISGGISAGVQSCATQASVSANGQEKKKPRNVS